MTKELNISKIVKEDVLRILGETNNKVSFETARSRIKIPDSILSRIIKRLEQENLIKTENGFIRLTTKGRDEAKDILKKHLFLENYFKKRRSEIKAHQIAHLLEHYVSEEVINDIKKLSTFKDEGIPLTKFKLHKEGTITDITFSNSALFERIISMGIFLGEKLIVTNEIHHGVIVKIRNKKFALDKELAKEIKVVEYEKP